MAIERLGVEETADDKSERLFLLGDRLRDAGRYDQAWRAFLRSALRGHGSSQLSVGAIYSEGRGIRRCRSKARHWFLRALADPGSAASAATNLGITYLEAGSVRRARWWLERAIALGDDDARLHLGYLMLAAYGEVAQAGIQFRRLENSLLATAAGNEAGRNWRAVVEGMRASHGSEASP